MSRRTIGFIVLFIESILLFIVTFLFVFRFTLLNKSYVLSKMDSINFYDKQYDEIKKEMSYYTSQSGFDDSIIDNIFSPSDVKKSIDLVVNNIYLGKVSDINTKDIESKFTSKIDKYIKDNNYKEVNDKEINDFVLKMSSIYKDEVKFMNYTDKVIFMPKVLSLVNEVLAISFLVLVVLIIVNKKVFHRKNYSVLFFTSSFLFIFLNIYIYSHIDIKNIYIYNDIVTSLVNSIIKDVLSISVFISVIYIIIGLLLSIFIRGHHNKF